MNNNEVIRCFLDGEKATTKNLFSEHKNGKVVLYSYGNHFPLCVMLKDGTLLFNLNGYSQTTAIHKGDLSRVLGYADFKDMIKNRKDTILLSINELDIIIRDENINSYAEFITTKI